MRIPRSIHHLRDRLAAGRGVGVADQIMPIGLAMPCPAISGAEPCTGSNTEGKLPSGLILPDGAMPIVPVQAGPRSERMSPNRLDATTTLNVSGLSTNSADRISM